MWIELNLIKFISMTVVDKINPLKKPRPIEKLN